MGKHKSKQLESGEVIDLLKRINEGATNNDTPLGELLRLCMRLGKQLGNNDLIKWARSEAVGYDDWSSLPDYRVLNTQVKGDFFGPFGSGLKNASIPEAVVDKEHRENLFNAHMTQPVGELERLANADNKHGTLKSNWSGDAIAYYQQKEIYTNGLALANAWRELTQYAISGILETIRTRVLDFVLRIEEELNINSASSEPPEEISRPEQKKVDQIVHNTFYGASNVSVANSGTVNQTTINVQAGDLESLKSFLKSAGITDELIEELDKALSADIKSDSQPGPAAQNWLGKIMLQIGKGTLALSGNVTGSIIANALMRFYDLP